MPRTQHTLTVQNLESLDNGRPVTAINQAIKQAVEDCTDRPGDSTARKVVIEILMKPELETELATLHRVHTQIKVKTLLPVRKSVQYPMKPISGSGIVFSELSATDPEQGSLYDDPDVDADLDAPLDADSNVGD